MYCQTNKYKIYYEKYGNKKKTVLILPGWGETRESFSFLINNLKKEYTIYIIDYPGFGNSPFPKHNMTIYDYASIVKSFIEKNKLKDLNIIAHSFGGRIAIILDGLYNLQINKMIFLDIAGIKKFSLKRLYKNSIYKILRLLGNLLPKKLRNKYLKLLFKAFASTDYQSINPNMYQTFKNIINTNLKKYVKKIKSEVLIIWGIYDQDTPLYIGNYLNKHIKNNALIKLNGHHFIYLEYPYLILKIIYIFI